MHTNACPHGKLDGVGNNKGDHRKRQRRHHVQLGDNHQLHRTACIGNKQHRDTSVIRTPGKQETLPASTLETAPAAAVPSKKPHRNPPVGPTMEARCRPPNPENTGKPSAPKADTRPPPRTRWRVEHRRQQRQRHGLQGKGDGPQRNAHPRSDGKKRDEHTGARNLTNVHSRARPLFKAHCLHKEGYPIPRPHATAQKPMQKSPKALRPGALSGTDESGRKARPFSPRRRLCISACQAAAFAGRQGRFDHC